MTQNQQCSAPLIEVDDIRASMTIAVATGPGTALCIKAVKRDCPSDHQYDANATQPGWCAVKGARLRRAQKKKRKEKREKKIKEKSSPIRESAIVSLLVLSSRCALPCSPCSDVARQVRGIQQKRPGRLAQTAPRTRLAAADTHLCVYACRAPGIICSVAR